MNQLAYAVYGHELSLFSRKLEAAMIFYEADFSFLPQDLTMNQRAGTHQIPVLQTPENWVIADTTPILQMMDARFPERALCGGLCGEQFQGFLIRLIEEYLDEWVARTMVHYRWHYDECAEFAAIKLGNGVEELAKGIAQWGPRACRATGTESQYQQECAEREYEELLQAADSQLQKTKFLFGDRPTAIDAIFLGGLRGHTYADPVPKRVVEGFPNVVQWLSESADNWDGLGEYLPVDAPGDFIMKVLEQMPNTYKPFILANKQALETEEKAFVCKVYDEDVSFLKRPYPELSRKMLVKYLVNLEPDIQGQINLFLDKFDLKEIFQ